MTYYITQVLRNDIVYHTGSLVLWCPSGFLTWEALIGHKKSGREKIRIVYSLAPCLLYLV